MASDARHETASASDTGTWNNMIRRPKRGVPEGLWRRCPGCQETIFRKEAERRQGVCPQVRLSLVRFRDGRRIDQVLDEGTFEEWDAGTRTGRPA